MTAWLLLNLGAVAAAAAFGLAGSSTSRARPLGLATLAGYLAIVHTLVLGAGLLGHLTVVGLVVLLTVTLALALWLARRATAADEARDARAPLTTWGVFAALAASAALVVWTWPHVVEATRLWIWDDYTYHMVYPSLWLREHAIAAPSPAQAFTMQAWYPLSASVVATWFMVPWPGSRGDALAWVSLTGPLYAGLVATATAAILARAGCGPGAWAVPLVLFATSPRLGIMASSFSDADLAVAATLFGGLAFSIPRGALETTRELRTDAAYAGLLTGLALGVKVSAAPLALVIVLVLALRARQLAAPRRPLVEVGLVIAATWLGTAGYWYARNAVHTGNPVYPAAFLLWPGTTFPETTLLEYGRHYGLRRALADALVVYADWPRSHAALAALGLAGLAAWLALTRRPLPRGRKYYAIASLALAITTLALQPLAPYSAGNAMTFRSGFVHWDSMRYVALLPILGWGTLGFMIDAIGGAWSAPAAAALVAATFLTSAPAPLGWSVVPAALVLSVAAAAWRPRAGIGAPRRQILGVAAVALVVAAIVVGHHRAKATATTVALEREPLYGAVVAALDRQPPGTRVAVFGDQWVYPAFGARNHLSPIRVDRDGRVATHPIDDAMEPGDLTVDPATFRANLRASGVDVVVVVRLPHPGRAADLPMQDAALHAIADARLLHRDAAAAVWRLGP